jgi:hypothetical protein
MASTGIHFTGSEQPAARVQKFEGARDPYGYSYISVDVSADITLFLPSGPSSVHTARALAAALLQAAEEHEAYLATAPAEPSPATSPEQPPVEPAAVAVPEENEIVF